MLLVASWYCPDSQTSTEITRWHKRSIQQEHPAEQQERAPLLQLGPVLDPLLLAHLKLAAL